MMILLENSPTNNKRIKSEASWLIQAGRLNYAALAFLQRVRV